MKMYPLMEILSLKFEGARKVKEKFLLNFFTASYESNFFQFFNTPLFLKYLRTKNLDNSTFFCAVLKWCFTYFGTESFWLRY